MVAGEHQLETLRRILRAVRSEGSLWRNREAAEAAVRWAARRLGFEVFTFDVEHLAMELWR